MTYILELWSFRDMFFLTGREGIIGNVWIEFSLLFGIYPFADFILNIILFFLFHLPRTLTQNYWSKHFMCL